MANAISELTATDYFDYFVNNFESVGINKSTNRTNAVLDSNINTSELYSVLKEKYLVEILNKDEFKNSEVTFIRQQHNPDDFIVATLIDPHTESKISVELDKSDSPTSTKNAFMTGLNSIKSTYAKEVIEMKSW
ncbi:MAG TPA: hypothetical protein H9820_13160 [Candidatus Companilactobacillus pullicola]|uniref:Uncharacterized protein n=1 Tax=Candidatus Companilactobacillus pullicola TaxID=2838523 RepID=A0A9D1ZQ50_9LACO|nr:hypothetical protein [Candidatus Companilactobacillus pullicola]